MSASSIRTCAKISVTAAALIASVHATADTSAQSKARRDVDRSVHEIVVSYEKNDLDKYFSYYDDNMLICCLRGEPWSKQAYYELWKQLIANGGGVAKAEVTNLEIRISPSADAAIAFYQMPVVRRMPAAGQDPNVTYNMTEVWMKSAGKWHVEGLAFSVAGPPPSSK
jgi:ketosteroid isomerase-like protein